MKQNRLLSLITILMLAFAISALYGQTLDYEGPIDPAGDPAAEREVKLDGNRFLIDLNNNGYTGHWGFLDGTKWPANSAEGLEMYDDCRILVGSRVYLENDSIPVTDPTEISIRNDLQELVILEAPTHDWSESSPDGTAAWTLTPVFGYFNEYGETPATSIDPNSWPLEGWPSRGFEKKWPGEWNGRFGRGIQYAQMESYSVINDAQDQEFLQPGQPLKYFPRRKYDSAGNIESDVLIGDIRESVTTAKGEPWGGLGIRIEMRGYQWDNPQSRDAVFWEYNIANISEYRLPEVVFGYYMDLGIGHYINTSDGEDDVGYFNKELNLSFCWDTNGSGLYGYDIGTIGFAFLESPGIPDDNIDNDSDGILDEKRDNLAVIKVGPTDGINDIGLFLQAYGFESVADLKEHWDADEDQDWRDGNDENSNGIYDTGEIAGDDVGLDGVGPADLNYNGPDADGTECNHKPDLLLGEGCEPNFGLLDITESDMLGLQTFHLFPHPRAQPPQSMHDLEAYIYISDHVLQEDPYSNPTNLYQAFGTGPFPLGKGRTERISMATIAAFENLETLSENLEAPIIYERKRVVQQIYESDYRFARPPEMPTLKSFAGNGKVILTWDERADKLTREPLAGGENDFEGYKLYKATDRSFDDALLLRDGFGNPSGLKPIAQWDLINEYQGHTDYALVEGEGFYLGSNTGIQHYYVDNNVDNGRVYYYFLAAYDRGLKEKNIAPSENIPTIKVDENEVVNFQSPNVQIVTPRAPAAGFNESAVEILHDPENIDGPAESSAFNARIVDPTSVKSGHEYQMTFDVDTIGNIPSSRKMTGIPVFGYLIINDGFKIFDTTEDILVCFENPEHFVKNHIVKLDTSGGPYNNIKSVTILQTGKLIETDVFDGIQVEFNLPLPKYGQAAYDSLGSGWVSGNGMMHMTRFEESLVYFPYEMDMVFTGEGDMYTSRITKTIVGQITARTGLTGLTSSDFLLGQSFPFYIVDKKHKDANGDYIKLDLLAMDADGSGDFDVWKDDIFVGHVRDGNAVWLVSLFSLNFRGISEGLRPQPGDVYRFKFNTPFFATDTLAFRVPEIDLSPNKSIQENLNDIKVVPNPYVVTNTLEPSVRNNNLNQRRKIMFTHLPAVCTIKIFTMSGFLVDKIDVNNLMDNGMAYWDVLTREDLEVAPGVYLYHVKSETTGKEKLGKFAIIK